MITIMINLSTFKRITVSIPQLHEWNDIAGIIHLISYKNVDRQSELIRTNHSFITAKQQFPGLESFGKINKPRKFWKSNFSQFSVQ